MPKTFCLLPNKVEKFKKALKNRKIKIADLLNMSSKKRTELLKEYAGENAKDVNLLFEKKLVLKNKMIGLQNWASKLGEIGRYNPKKVAELKRMREEYKKMQEERIFNPAEEQTFLNALADQALGTRITRAESKIIFDMTTKLDKLKESYNKETGVWESVEAKQKYGANKVILENYIKGLTKEKDLKAMILDTYYRTKSNFKENKARGVTELVKETLQTISDNAVAFVASIDNSFMGRQGLNTLLTQPKIWKKMAKDSFVDIYKSLVKKEGSQVVKDAVMADVYSRENYLNRNYEKAKLIPKAEEQFPTTLPEKIPVIGRAFSASEAAFTNSAIRARINTFDKIYKIAKEQGIDVTKKEFIQDLGTLINSVTGRGNLGKMGEGGLIKLLLWAPKLLKGNWDVLTAHTGGAGLKTAFARKQARLNLIKITGVTSGIVAVINALYPNSVETDPRSSDFLKIRVGNTRFDLTGGKGSLITLLARLMTMSSKSATTGIIKELNTGQWGDTSMFDVGIDFLKNKTAPFPRAAISVLEGKTFDMEKPTVAGFIGALATPISIKNFIKTHYGDTYPKLEEIISDFVDLLGVGGGTYAPKENWETKTSKEMNQFRGDVGEENFSKANKEYNEIIAREIESITKSEGYKSLSEEDKEKEIKRIKRNAKNKIFEKYNP